MQFLARIIMKCAMCGRDTSVIHGGEYVCYACLLTQKCGTKVDQEHGGKTLVIGFCEEGPYKYADALLRHPDVSWVPWHYHISKLSTDVINLLDSIKSLSFFSVVFTSWPPGFVGRKTVIRTGMIDYFRYENGFIRMTIKLDCVRDLSNQEIDIRTNQSLCFLNCSGMIGGI